MQSEQPKLRILQIEDDAADAGLMVLRLKRAGVSCDVIRVETESAFCAALDTVAFDLIVSDSNVPCFDALSALAIAANRVLPVVPFIVLSGNANPKVKAEMLACGVTDYVNKDEPAEFIAAVKRIAKN
jgi:CheY-like chemotaxis protein